MKLKSLFLSGVFYLIAMNLAAQPIRTGLSLDPGSAYRITQHLVQETASQSGGTGGSASLDVRITLDLTVLDTAGQDSYSVACSYDKLSLSLFAPSLDVAISSERRSDSEVRTYLDRLEQYTFRALLTTRGELGGFSGLNAFIDGMRESPGGNSSASSILIKTIREAFGEEALTSMFNISMNIYGPGIEGKVERRVIYYFNTRPLELQTSLYFQPPTEGMFRVQGLGVFPEQQKVLDLGNKKATSFYSGNQTFDLLFDARTGWLLDGSSKQRLSIITAFSGYSEYPEGLRIPSRTDSEIYFSGELIKEENQKVR